jgi:hypothetical protein
VVSQTPQTCFEPSSAFKILATTRALLPVSGATRA